MAIGAADQRLLDEADASLLDPLFFGKGNPYPLYDALRRHDPVHWTKGPMGRGYWQVTRYAEGAAVFQNSETYSSGLAGDVVPMNLDVNYTKPEMGVGQIMAWTDRPRHTEMRVVLNPPFSPRNIATLEGKIRRIVREMLDQAVARGEGDIGEALFQIPIRVVVPLIGLPDEDTEKLYRITMMAMMPAEICDPSADLAAAQQEGMKGLMDYGRGMIRERQERPTDDLVGVLVKGRDAQGQPFDIDRMAWNVASFFIAGFETTAYALTAGLLELTKYPDQLAALRRDRSLIPSAVEEYIRWSSPSLNMMRTATVDTELAGRKIRTGDWVSVSTHACNRDPEVFDNPQRFDVARNPNRHIAFGSGVHTCIGMHLARLEIRIFLEELLNMIGEIELVGEPRYANTIVAYGVRGLPLRLKAALKAA